MRTIIISLLIFFCCTGCKNDNQKISTKETPKDSTSKKDGSINIPAHQTTGSSIDSSIVYADSAVILDEVYKVLYKANDMLYVLNPKNDTILKAADLHQNFEFDDFNADGMKDIRVHFLGNVPFDELLLFDKTKKNFRLVKDFHDFPEPIALQGTKYYYSYHRSGCADMDWDSDLFYLDNYKAIRIGNIAGRQCDNRDGVKDAVYIHKVNGTKETLFKTLPIDTIWKYKDVKWGFIKEYWTKNYKQFFH